MQSKSHSVNLQNCPDVMSIYDMCSVLSISTKTGYRLLKEGKIKCLKVGRSYRIPKAHILTYLGIADVNPDTQKDDSIE